MTGYVVRRLLQGLLAILGVTFITFMLPAIFANNIAYDVLGIKATPYAIKQFNHNFGFDQPILVQYYHYMIGLLHGNLGKSASKVHYGHSVSSLIAVAMWRTLWLSLISLIISLSIAIPVGLVQALRRNTVLDYSVTFGVFIVYSTPVFALGIILISIFAVNLHWFPPGAVNGTEVGIFAPLTNMFQNWQSFVLPVAVLVGLTVGGFTRYMRGSVLDALVQDYVRTARAKGASPNRVLYRHAFRNAILPILTILGLSLPGLFSGALITETLFNYPGMGFLTVGAISGNDIFLVMGTTLVIALFTIIGNIIADLMVAAADPRVRLTGKN